ncbi:MAG: glycerate kinase [Cytophagales bacterium]|nr:glycerate kinase [Cytophagales bacterium]
MKIVVAPNSFKGSLDAFKVAKSIENGLLQSKLEVNCELFPIADGGDHTLEVFHSWLGGEIRHRAVPGPLGEKVTAEWLSLENGRTAVIEMAKASGMNLVDKSNLDPLKANSFGTGELILEAVMHGAEKIILGLGGSATVDGGLGILQAFGAELLDSNGRQIDRYRNPLLELDAISTGKFDPKLSGIHFTILSDVENPLLGLNGAAHIFGPQKGAGPEEVELLEKAMQKFNKILIRKTGSDLSKIEGAGAAGGIAVALKSFFNATVVGGVDFLLEKMNFEASLKTARYLITAEGKADAQTLQGKGPFGVAEKARSCGIPSIILTGKADDFNQLNQCFNMVLPITNGPMTLQKAMDRTAIDLEETARQIGNLLAAV